MSDPTTPRLDAPSGGAISRRQLLHSMAAMAVAAPALGRIASSRGDGFRPALEAPLEPPFEPTGWQTVWLDHLNYQCVDYRKAAAFYATLMGWKVRSDDGRQCTLDIGDNSGGIIIRGGLTAPPPAAITDAGLGVNRPPVQAVFDGFAWGIAPWDEKAVRAALEQRGLNPVADHRGADYRAFRVKDPDGFDVAITNGTKALRRKTPATGALPAPAPFAPTGWNTLYLDHISFEVPDYRRSAAFYQALLGWEARPMGGGGGQVSVQIGTIAGAIIRGNAAARAATAAARARGDTSAAGAIPTGPNAGGAAIGHISFGIENWNTERVRAELKQRDVVYVTRDGQREPRPDMTGTLESFHVPDAMGWDLQIGNKIAPGR